MYTTQTSKHHNDDKHSDLNNTENLVFYFELAGYRTRDFRGGDTMKTGVQVALSATTM